MKTICIYHSRDLDGWMSAAIVKKWFISNNKNYILNGTHHARGDSLSDLTKDPSITFLGWDYGDPIPNLSEYDKVIMCDVSFEPIIMKGLIDTFGTDFTWIDHHKSALLSIGQYLPYIDGEGKIIDLPGIRDTSFAACELTWKYFFPKEEMPEIVRLLGRYDCFGHKGTDEEQKVLEFQCGARQAISDYTEAYVFLNDARSTMDISIKGTIIYQYLCTEAKQIYKKAYPITVIEPIKAENALLKLVVDITEEPLKRKFLAVNAERFNPANYGIDYHKEGYDGFASFWLKGNGKWECSLYNDNGKIDCSNIAKTNGGGGHKGAAGFTFDEIPTWLKK